MLGSTCGAGLVGKRAPTAPATKKGGSPGEPLRAYERRRLGEAEPYLPPLGDGVPTGGFDVLPVGGLGPGPLVSGICSSRRCSLLGTLPCTLVSAPLALPVAALAGGGGGVAVVCAYALNPEATRSTTASVDFIRILQWFLSSQRPRLFRVPGVTAPSLTAPLATTTTMLSVYSALPRKAAGG
jgi:hypothetical protein